MKFFNLFTLFFIGCVSLFPQEGRPITTAFPFLLSEADAVASGRGMLGVASAPDVFSQRWNSSKYIFSEQKTGLGISYNPYLGHLVSDIFSGNLSYYRKAKRGVWAGSFTYFSIGQVRLVEEFQGSAYVLGGFRPAEFALDVSYNLRLGKRFSLGVLARYLRSDLQLPTEEKFVGVGISSDISGYYQSKEHLLGKYFGRSVWGFQISNLGTKIRYNNLGKEFFLPANLKLGGSYFLVIDAYNEISFMTEINKLLVPTLEEGENIDVLQGIFRSFSDAPNGFSEELQEIFWTVGIEYIYDKSFFLRMGYFNQHKNKGDRKHFTLGAGFKLSHWQFDFSYLLAVAKTANPLNKSLRISLQYGF